ncbi:hypothetical protein BDW66DRAFT_69925 [Aspergillus desertorum]
MPRPNLIFDCPDGTTCLPSHPQLTIRPRFCHDHRDSEPCCIVCELPSPKRCWPIRPRTWTVNAVYVFLPFCFVKVSPTVSRFEYLLGSHLFRTAVPNPLPYLNLVRDRLCWVKAYSEQGTRQYKVVAVWPLV